ncbi:MAG: xanthine dehydrogenase family protein molybdopterin-binding subunit [Anaerolineaceae bacterium]|nr:xanthine dehydrogenase family protein molybdopterin-binding subunit [Anaerolineaceae bacterium]
MKITAKPLPPVELPELHQIGQPVRRVDALSKTVGATVYAGDYYPPNLLYGKVFRSNIPHGRIIRLDTSKARNLPGVVSVITAKDMEVSVLVTDMPGQTGQKRRAGSDAQVLAADEVRFIGEAIALVAAESEALAEQALRLIEVEYEPLPSVYDPIEAMQPGAPQLYPPDNVVAHWKIRKGDVAAGMAAADLIVENTFKSPYQEHAYLEPEAGVAWTDERGVINIRVSTQVVEHFRSISLAIGVPQNKLRIQGTMVGGGFGGKEDITVEIFLGLMAKATGRPVRLVYTREESILAHSKRHPYIITHRTGVTRDGRITAAEIKLISNSGAYVYLSPYVLLYSTGMATGPYRIDNVAVNAVSVATNNPFTSAFRGFGAPQVCVAYEQQMDEIAKALHMDPFELRRINYVHQGDFTAHGQELTSAVWLEETTSRAIEALGEKTPDWGSYKVGQGFASYMQSYGRITWMHDTSQAWVGLEMDGTATIRAGVPDLGAGQVSALCQITSEVLGVPMKDITIYHTDSAVTPLSGTSTATRQLYMSGNATLQAATVIRKNLLDRASKHFEEAPEDLDLADGKVFVKAHPEENMRLSQLIAMCASDGTKLAELAMFKAPFTGPIDSETGQGQIWPDFTYGALAAEVAVDTETGEIRLLKSVACHDVGRAINMAAVDGQIQGGASQGLGYALMEDLSVEKGRIRAGSLSEYLIPTTCDLPTTKSIILESGTGMGPFGAKGIGEPSLTPAAPAVANAVANAIGARVYELPLTPERVLEAVDRAQKSKSE